MELVLRDIVRQVRIGSERPHVSNPEESERINLELVELVDQKQVHDILLRISWNTSQIGPGHRCDAGHMDTGTPFGKRDRNR